MRYSRYELKRRLKDISRRGWSDHQINDLIDSLWRDPVPPLPYPDDIHYGGEVVRISGLTFSVGETGYYLQNRPFVAFKTTITLDEADPDLPRIDVLAVDINGKIVVIKGEPSAEWFKPRVDPLTQIEITFVKIPANSTEPEGVTGNLIFNENAPGEWAPSVFGVAVDFDSPVSPFMGSKCANVGAIGTGDLIRFTSAEIKKFADFETLSFAKKVKEAMSKQHFLQVEFLLNEMPVSNIVTAQSLALLTGAWEVKTLRISSFQLSGTDFNSVQFRWMKSGQQVDHAGFYLDMVKLEAGVSQPPVVEDSYVNEFYLDEATSELVLKQTNNRPSFRVLIPNSGGGGTDGREVELSVVGDYIVWRYLGEANWINLIALSLLQGPPGDDGAPGAPGDDGAPGAPGAPGSDGREIELRENAGYVEWRYLGDVSWTQLYLIPTGGGGGVKQVTGLTLIVANWTDDGGLFKYVLSDVNIKATSSVEVIPANGAYDILVAAEPQPETTSALGSVTVWVKNVPAANIPVTINIHETV